MLALAFLPPSEEGGGPREGAVEGENKGRNVELYL